MCACVCACACARARVFFGGAPSSPGVGFVQTACAIDEDTADDKRHHRLLMHVAEVRAADASGGAANRLSETRYTSPARSSSSGERRHVSVRAAHPHCCACACVRACFTVCLCSSARAIRVRAHAHVYVRVCVRITRAQPSLVGARVVLCCVCPRRRLDGQTLVEVGTGCGTAPPPTVRHVKAPPGRRDTTTAHARTRALAAALASASSDSSRMLSIDRQLRQPWRRVALKRRYVSFARRCSRR